MRSPGSTRRAAAGLYLTPCLGDLVEAAAYNTACPRTAAGTFSRQATTGNLRRRRHFSSHPAALGTVVLLLLTRIALLVIAQVNAGRGAPRRGAREADRVVGDEVAAVDAAAKPLLQVPGENGNGGIRRDQRVRNGVDRPSLHCHLASEGRGEPAVPGIKT